MLEKNIERVVDLVLRTMADAPEQDSVQDVAGQGQTNTLVSEEQLRSQMTTLAGHVAVALRGMHTHSVASYRQPGGEEPPHSLDVRR